MSEAVVRDQMDAIAQATTTKPPRLRRRSITLADGHRIGLSVCGEGVPLVMIHGVIAEGMLYARTLRRLAGAGFKVIAVDSAGHGRTGGLGRKGWSFEHYIDLHEQVLDHLGIERAVFVGHSMGGRVVVDLAARKPERAIAVIPINAAIGGTWEELTGATKFLPLLFPLGVGLLVTDTAISALQGRKEMGHVARLAAPSLLQRVRELPSMPAALFATLAARGSIDTLRYLGDEGVPVFVLHGDRDLAIWFHNARQAAKAAKGTLVRIERGLHSWLLEDADSLPAVLGSLLETSLGQAIADRAESVEACYGPEALALTVDRPRSKPYQLDPSHRWRIEPTR
ncbi:MAG TPA: alpha/beta hydrolase [Acidimicrobiales bacterium]|nr:alpha/beta hydrolase [Acidimicrobiales bacterium]